MQNPHQVLQTVQTLIASADQPKPRKVLTSAEQKQVAEYRSEINAMLKSGDTELIPLYTRAIKRIEGPLFS